MINAGNADALIVGAGLAGSAAACLLARQGRRVLLLDREKAPHHKVCGEFLSVEAAQHLGELGLDLAALGANPIDRIRLVSGGIEAEAPLPFRAFGLSRYVLDEVLLALAVEAGATVERGVRVLELDGLVARTSLGERRGAQVLLATGKLPVRERSAPPPGRVDDGHVGFKMHYRLALPATRRLAGTILLVLLDGGYAGLQLIEGGRANLCLVMRRTQLARIGGDWSAVLRWLTAKGVLKDMLCDAEPLFERPLTIANLAYGPPTRAGSQGPVLKLGDQWAMTASLTGDGMAIALRSAFIAARSLAANEDAQTYHRRIAGSARSQIVRAMALQRALERPLLRQAGCRLARSFPSLLTYAARGTRIDEWSSSGL